MNSSNLLAKCELYIKSRITVDSTSGCWSWNSCKNPDGYAFGGRNVILCREMNEVLIHRASYRLFRGIIPEGLCVLHTCDNPSCVNPDHLWLGTHQDNMDDMWSKNRRRIKYGEDSHVSKLTYDDVVFIRDNYKYRDKNFSAVGLAKKYNVTPSCIHHVLKNRYWKDIKDMTDLQLHWLVGRHLSSRI